MPFTGAANPGPSAGLHNPVVMSERPSPEQTHGDPDEGSSQ
jgi:hypothetical protein